MLAHNLKVAGSNPAPAPNSTYFPHGGKYGEVTRILMKWSKFDHKMTTEVGEKSQEAFFCFFLHFFTKKPIICYSNNS